MTANLTLVTDPARSVVAPRRTRARWSKPWWWLPARYQQHRASLQKQIKQLEAALIVISVAVGPPLPGGAA